MAIEFACPKCGKRFRLKAELAGRVAKCACGTKLRIPQPKVAVGKPAAGKSAASKTSVQKAHTGPPAPHAKTDPRKKAAPAQRSTSRKRGSSAGPALAAAATKSASTGDSDLSSWLDEELDSAPAMKPVPGGACPSCSAPLSGDAVICVACGFDRRTGSQHSLESVAPQDASRKKSGRTKSGFALSLMRGTFFSFLGALLGAVIWATITFFTMYEFGFVAWGLGALCGIGMAIGHEDDDGTAAGIIAAFMSLFGIVAAKIFIAIIVVIFFVSQFAGMLDEAVVDPDSPAGKRQILAVQLSGERIEQLDDDASWSDIEQVMADAKADVAAMSDEEVERRWQEYEAEWDMEGDESDSAEGTLEGTVDGAVEMDGGPSEEFADEDSADFYADDDDIYVEEDYEDEGGGFWTAFGGMFGIVDSIFILLAFATAYQLGSGKMTD